MKNKFKIIFFTYILLANNISFAQEIKIDADKIKISNKNKIYASGNVKLEYLDNIIKSKNIKGFLDKKIYELSGNVILQKNDLEILAEYTKLNSKEKILELSGNVKAAKKNILISAGKAIVNDNKKETKLFDFKLQIDKKQIANGKSIKINKNETKSDFVEFTPCSCKNNLWSMHAKKLEHDITNKNIMLYDSVFKIKNIPAMYLPYISFPDSSVNRRSGLTNFDTGHSKNTGQWFLFETFFTLGDYSDITITPYLSNNKQNSIETNYRTNTKRSKSNIDLKFSDDIINNNKYISGKFQNYFQMNNEWTLNTDLENIKNRKAFENFEYFGYAPNYSLSKINLKKQKENSIFTFKTNSYDYLAYDKIEDIYILPEISYEKQTKENYTNGTIKIKTNIKSQIEKNTSIIKRFSNKINYSNKLIKGGLLINLDSSIRHDYYKINFKDKFLEENTNYKNEEINRFIPKIGLKASFPFYSKGINKEIFEPVIGLYFTKKDSNNTNILKNFSNPIETTNSNLFSLDRSYDIDLIDDNSRFAYGVNYKISNQKNEYLKLFIGKSNKIFTEKKVTEIDDPDDKIKGNYLLTSSLFYKDFNVNLIGELNYSNLKLDKIETELRKNIFGFDLILNYSGQREIENLNRKSSKQIGFDINYKINNNWEMQLNGQKELSQNKETLENNLGLSYKNDCAKFKLNVFENNVDKSLPPENGYRLSITLGNF